jgi:hypothetical protein
MLELALRDSLAATEIARRLGLDPEPARARRDAALRGVAEIAEGIPSSAAPCDFPAASDRAFAYVQARLAPVDADTFEAHYFDCAGCWELVHGNDVRSLLAGPRAEIGPGVRRRLRVVAPLVRTRSAPRRRWLAVSLPARLDACPATLDQDFGDDIIAIIEDRYGPAHRAEPGGARRELSSAARNNRSPGRAPRNSARSLRACADDVQTAAEECRATAARILPSRVNADAGRL